MTLRSIHPRALSFIFYASLILCLSKAHADVAPGAVTHVYMNFGSRGSDTQASQYRAFIESLRRAAGHDYRQGVLITQQNHTEGLIQATFTTEGRTITLWITPQDLYVRGFTNAHGHTFEFNDPDYDLRDALTRLRANPTGGNTRLPFGSNYNSLARAGTGRQNLQISFHAFDQAFRHLADATNAGGRTRQDIAESLMLMIQLTSESARFVPVFDSAVAAMRNSTVTNRLTDGQQVMENNWAVLSNYGLAVTQNPRTHPTTVRNLGTYRTFADLVRVLAMMVNQPYNAPGGIKGDWNHSEL